MTTVTYAGGIMASDSRCTDDFGAFSTRAQKIYRLHNRALLGIAGDADVRDVCEILGKANSTKLPSRKELRDLETDLAAILVFQNGSIFFVDIGHVDDGHGYWTSSIIECREKFAAVGSGQQFAIGALASGKTARQAIEVACRFDTASGLPVVEVPLKPLIKSEPPAAIKSTKPKRTKK